MQPLCHNEERDALLKFKHSLSLKLVSGDPFAYPKVASWKPERESDCCSTWDGVECDQDTGHVIGLELESSFLYGSIDSNSGLFDLVHLQTLNLANNDFNYSQIPSEIGKLSSLSMLDFSACHFSGYLPASLNNLTLLTHLVLDTNQFSGPIPILESLSQLTYLSLSLNKSGGGDMFWLGKLTKLTNLELYHANLSGEIPSSLANLTQLSQIVLADNHVTGKIPSWLTNMTQVTCINLADNQLQGQIPSSFSQLKNLDNLNLNNNTLSGMVEVDAFLSLKKLTKLEIGGNQITLLTNNRTNETLPRFRLLTLYSCNLEEFPHFLRFQDELELLLLNHNQIRGKIPEWVLNISKGTLEMLDLRSNMLEGFDQLPEVLPWAIIRSLALSNNMLRRPLPVPSPTIFNYEVSSNFLSGEIPSSFCNMSYVNTLELFDNDICGTIPPCLGNLSSLEILNLKGNKFSGKILQTYEKGNNLRLIDLSQNRLEGQMPRSLANCTNLEILNLSDNQIKDTFPFWLGALPEIKVLVLRSNKFHGAIEGPTTIEDFPKLRIIDLSCNGFTSYLPFGYFMIWNAMKTVHEDQVAYLKANIAFPVQGRVYDFSYAYTMTIINKAIKSNYDGILNIFVVIDLSSNIFKGEIPQSVGNLKGLQSLNLSNNDLTGPIPPSLAQLSQLESLDLSRNRLLGEIPRELVLLNFLAVLSVSYNNLSGLIPKGKQFDTFLNDSYIGNSALCGHPLSKRCGDPRTMLPSTTEQGDDTKFLNGVDWVIICLGVGSGLIIGLISGHILTTRNHEWFVEKYGKRKMN
ncbi:hypothetical protein LguiB_002177 [Lonicera macranthoides]